MVWKKTFAIACLLMWPMCSRFSGGIGWWWKDNLVDNFAHRFTPDFFTHRVFVKFSDTLQIE
jgi:hypothetical protein